MRPRPPAGTACRGGQILVSAHSTQAQVVCDYGIFGAGLLLAMTLIAAETIVAGLRRVWFTRRFESACGAYLVAAAALSMQVLMAFTSIGAYVFWILVAFHFYSARLLRSSEPEPVRSTPLSEPVVFAGPYSIHGESPSGTGSQI